MVRTLSPGGAGVSIEAVRFETRADKINRDGPGQSLQLQPAFPQGAAEADDEPKCGTTIPALRGMNTI